MEKATRSTERSPVRATLEVIGGRWKPLILYFLFFEGTQRFGELRRKLEEVTQQMLTSQLRDLERDGIIDRKVYPVVPPKVEYSLTELGRTLGPVLRQMMEWGEMYQKTRRAKGNPPGGK